MKKKFEDLSTKYGSVTMSIFETAWKDDQKTIRRTNDGSNDARCIWYGKDSGLQ